MNSSAYISFKLYKSQDIGDKPMKNKFVSLVFIFVILVVFTSLFAKSETIQNQKLIIILPFKYTGSDYMTSEGDLRMLAANSVQVELAREGYQVLLDSEINQKFIQLNTDLSELTTEELDTLNQTVHADIFITGELLKLPIPYRDNYKLKVIFEAKNTAKNTTIERLSMTYPVGYNTHWHNLLSEMSKQFIRSLKSRKAI